LGSTLLVVDQWQSGAVKQPQLYPPYFQPGEFGLPAGGAVWATTRSVEPKPIAATQETIIDRMEEASVGVHDV